MHRHAPNPRPRKTAGSPFPEPVTRLAAIRHSLQLVETFGDGPGSDGGGDDRAIAAGWSEAGPARRASFDRRSRQLVASTGAGLDALLKGMGNGRDVPQAASDELCRQIRRELSDIANLVLA